MKSSKVAAKLRAKIVHFSGELSKGLPKSAHRFVSEMIYGIQARQSVVLTKVLWKMVKRYIRRTALGHRRDHPFLEVQL